MTKAPLYEIETVKDIASDGRGIVRHENFVTFIPFTAEGDLIQYQTTQRKKNFAAGCLLKLLQPSPDRINPLCPYFGTCGGCQLQHIHYAKQLEHKRKWIEDALRKIGKFRELSLPPVTPANLQWSYRRHINLILKKFQNHYQAGYIATDNKSLVVINHCPIFTDFNDPLIKAVQEICRQLISSDSDDAKATLLKCNGSYIVHFHFRKMPLNAADILSKSLQMFPFFTGMLATSQKKSIKFGIVETSCRINELSFDFSTKSFIQNHPEQSVNIYNKIVDLAAALKPVRVLDLYCGIGISTLLLAQMEIHVTGIELNSESIKLALSNARKNHIENAAFAAADVETVLENLLEQEKPNLIIVNPPREGLSSKVVQLLESSSTPHIIYVSCMPSTLARDLNFLCQKNYSITSVNAFDMFPQTVHVETLVLLSHHNSF